MCKKILIISLSVFIVTFIICNFRFCSINNPAIKIEKSYINNDYNNSVHNYTEFLQVNDKLYYNCGVCPFQNGLYEISDKTTKQIYWTGLTTNPKLLCISYTYNNNILYDFIEDGYIKRFNIDTRRFENYINIITTPCEDAIDTNNKLSLFVVNNTLYVEDETLKKIYKYDSEHFTLAASAELCKGEFYPLYFDKEYMYFTYNDIENNEAYDKLYKYSLTDKSIVKSADVSFLNKSGDYSYINVEIAFDDEVYVGVHDSEKYGLFRIDMGNKKVKKVVEMDISLYSISISGYNHNVYIGVNDNEDNSGIYYLNSNDKLRKLYTGEVTGLYIFDEKYLYFLYDQEGEKISRITTDGKKTEKVFG